MSGIKGMPDEYEEEEFHEYHNLCQECGHRFTSGYIHVTICPNCLEVLGLHIEEEHYA